MSNSTEVVVAGHICLDLIPSFGPKSGTIKPGALIDVGTMGTYAGGVVANTGLALTRLGFEVTLIGKIGSDLFGAEIEKIIAGHLGTKKTDLVVNPDVSTSYTVIINQPGIDRTFLHHPGANDSFFAADIDDEALVGVRLFHFGYPPLMASMYSDNGAELTKLFSRVKAKGVTTSLDMARPDPQSPAGRANWKSILKKVLPYVDIFHPSVDELLYMLRPDLFENFTNAANLNPAVLDELLNVSISYGAAVVVLKLGSNGLMIRLGSKERLNSSGPAIPATFTENANTTHYSPCYEAKVIGATGAGDCTIAGFLAAALHGRNIADCINIAVGTGSCNVEKADALSGVLDWKQLNTRISNGWKKEPSTITTTGVIHN